MSDFQNRNRAASSDVGAVASALDALLVHYTLEINQSEQFRDTGLVF